MWEPLCGGSLYVMCKVKVVSFIYFNPNIWSIAKDSAQLTGQQEKGSGIIDGPRTMDGNKSLD